MGVGIGHADASKGEGTMCLACSHSAFHAEHPPTVGTPPLPGGLVSVCDDAAMRDLRMILPPEGSGYHGARLSYWYLIALTVVTTGRSVVHVFAADGGASSIAGIDIEVAGGDNIVAMFGQWGWSQLLLALVGWLIIVRYPFLVPLALLMQVLDWGGRMLVGGIKPLVIDSPPPGEIGNYIFLPLSLIALWFSLPKGHQR
jgi:hypothetical protein